MSSRNNMSPQNRRAMREDAEAAALAELEFEARARQEKSLKLRQARLAMEQKELRGSRAETKPAKKTARAR